MAEEDHQQEHQNGEERGETEGIPIHFPDELMAGKYTNHMVVRHRPEEFIMDFFLVAPPSGAVVSRIIVHPSHLKRIIKALQNNLDRYEENFGEVRMAEPPDRRDSLEKD